jgi:AcrR family transcriptional regulator
MKKPVSRNGSRKAGPSAKRSSSSRDLIVDAAELLFGDKTFDAVSTRDISRAAKVNLGLVQYYFQSKDALFEQVVARRAESLGQHRRVLLAALKAEGKPTVENLVDVFMRPLFEMMADASPGSRGYVLVLSQVGVSDRWLDLLDRYFDDTFRLFLVELRRLLPGVRKDRLLYGFNFSIIMMLSAVTQNRRLENLSDGKLSSSDLDKIYPNLIAFVSAGLRGLEAEKLPKVSRLSRSRQMEPQALPKDHSTLPQASRRKTKQLPA